MYSFPDLEPVCFSMFGSNCCFLTRIHISQEAGQVVWYSHLLKNFPQFVVIHTVKDFAIVNKAEIDFFFLEFSFFFFYDPMDVGNLISGSSAFSKSSLNIWKFTVHILLKPGLEKYYKRAKKNVACSERKEMDSSGPVKKHWKSMSLALGFLKDASPFPSLCWFSCLINTNSATHCNF